MAWKILTLLQVVDVSFDIRQTLINPVYVTFLLISDSLNLIKIKKKIQLKSTKQ